MENLFVSYEIAKQLKEKGFDAPCWAWYNIHDQDIRLCYSEQRSPITNSQEDWGAKHEKRNIEIIGLPMYQQVVDWFRDKHNVFFEITLIKTDYLKIEIKHNAESVYRNYDFSKENYYEALNKATEEALKLI